MTQNWQTTPGSRWFRPLAAVAAAALFFVGIAIFVVALLRPFDEPRLFLLVCDGDPATTSGSPLAFLAAANPGRTVYRSVTTPVGRNWLLSIEDLRNHVLPRDAVLVSLRGDWVDDPEPALQSRRDSGNGTTPEHLDIADVVTHLERLPAQTIILCLDDSDPDLDQFSERLRQSYSQAGPGRVVIVTAHMLGEESFPLPGRQCSAFGQVVAHALCPSADRNQDSGVSLEEFLAAIRQQVDGWAAALTGGRESQTPLVIEPAETRSSVLLSPVLHRASDHPLNESKTANELAETDNDQFKQLTALWQLSQELLDRGIARAVPLVMYRRLHRDILGLERRWRFGERSSTLQTELESRHAVLTALAAGDPLPSDGPQWANELAVLIHVAASDVPEPPATQGTFLQLEKLLQDQATKAEIETRLAGISSTVPNRTLRLVTQLTAAPQIPDNVWRDVLLTRLHLERVKSAVPRSSWTAADRTAAERAALRSERLLLDQIEQDWLKRAQHAQATAALALQRIHTIEQLHSNATAVCRRAQLMFPDFLDADEFLQFWENDPSEVGAVLDEMLASLAVLRVDLLREALDDPGRVEQLAASLQTGQMRLLEPVQQIVAHARINAAPPPTLELVRLLRTTWLSAPERIQLLTTWRQVAANLPLDPPRPTAAGRIIMRGLADGLAANSRRRVQFDNLYGDASACRAAALEIGQVEVHEDFVDALRRFDSLEQQWCLEQPGRMRKDCARLVAAPLDKNNFAQCRSLWEDFDGLQDDSPLPPDWPRLVERILGARKIWHLDRRIERLEMARNDAAAWERECYDREEVELRGARGASSQWPSPMHVTAATLIGPSSLVLNPSSATELNIRVENLEDPSQPTEVSVQYDASQYSVFAPDGRQILAATAPPWPYAEANIGGIVPIAASSADPRTITLLIQPGAVDVQPSPLLVRLQGTNWTARTTCQLLPPQLLPVDVLLRDEFGPVTSDGVGFSVEPYPNRMATLYWSLRNNVSSMRHIDVEIYAVESAQMSPSLPRFAIPVKDAAAIIQGVTPRRQVIQIPDISLPPASDPLPIPFPKQDDSKSPIPLQGGMIISVTDQESGLTSLQQVRIRPQRPARFVDLTVEYERTTGRSTILTKARSPQSLPHEGISVLAKLANVASGPQPARTTGLLGPQAPAATLTLVGSPGTPQRLEVDVAGWPRAFVVDVKDGAARISQQNAIRVTSPLPGAVYQSPGSIPVHVEVDAAPTGFVTESEGFEVGVDANHDRRLDGEHPVRIDRDRNVTLQWLGSHPDGSTTFAVSVGDFDLVLPTDGLQNQRAAILSRVVRNGGPEIWGEAVPVVFDSAPPQLSDSELQPGPTVVIGQPLVLLASADDAGLSGVASVQAGFDPSRTGLFDDKVQPLAAVPTEDGRWRVEAPTDKLEQGRHLLLARSIDNAGNAESPHLFWVDVITAEEFARRQAGRTTSLAGQLLFGKQPVSGITVSLTRDPTEAAKASEPM
ncbi:MAG: hypothetical protein KF861_03675, partial [Planctomycetaceae bacterium]|nr:hypothetical protein [Planctomycetaceae bacterium]